ncbi:guanylate kinase [Marinomonas mediterranea]|uniref:Guanylate kinase n=1 Tax=Marinomonas mediterranea (strain ATCC 700492 / JCM 21426 / NBRC 103028 / MMB-1) TaxID=717774 RepID=F2K0X7_MARM1|nr:guanylate kinase [Marinomonas mediterranea]ADZ93326.1 Guanylate kinase [Marinomonas mediterranea MMB-1]WCN11215.1 guanylate kinase [Marinomonas mediterranea]WCN19323.1 guanylate kinase [Marinomonas mediterranea MMB-1]
MAKKHLGNLFILSAPSGAGKSSLYKALLAEDSMVRISVSHTTRAAREGEQDGREYHFTNIDHFLDMIAEEAFFEHAQVFDNYYGTSKQAIFDMLEQGLDVILEIDWQGARQIREQYSDAIGIFILPPSIETLESRLRGRGTDSDEVIARRMSKAVDEISHYDEYDFVIVNDDFDDAFTQLRTIFTAMRSKTAVMKEKHTNLINDLLSL